MVSEFRKAYTEPPKEEVRRPSKSSYTSTPYGSFLKKYANLEDYIDKFSTRDLVYYFREIANESGYKYTIANIKKDMAIMKRLQKHYTPKEICGMIEFLYDSEQDYLEKDRLSPNLLASQWVNTIYADMQLWVEDKYVPKSKKANKTHDKSREWNNDNNSENDFIGNWEV